MPQKYKPEYATKYSDTGSSLKGEHYARCTLCGCDYSIKHSGAYEIVVIKFQKTKKHMDMVQIRGQHRPVSAVFETTDKVNICAEWYMALFIVDHNNVFFSAKEL